MKIKIFTNNRVEIQKDWSVEELIINSGDLDFYVLKNKNFKGFRVITCKVKDVHYSVQIIELIAKPVDKEWRDFLPKRTAEQIKLFLNANYNLNL